ncbi:uncharacterized protein BDW70DRAFT_32019 [Aspergillus foveolatus]|uniref:uncharacterized protein n=1 Tax=Aspergillus foveolatus TaxID=210207 RepID=UPI003CCCDDFA
MDQFCIQGIILTHEIARAHVVHGRMMPYPSGEGISGGTHRTLRQSQASTTLLIIDMHSSDTGLPLL